MRDNFPLRARVRENPPRWADETIRPWDEALFSRLEPFRTRVYWTDQGSVNVFRVVGTQHPDYAGRTWSWFLEGGKRMEANLALLERNPAYYDDTEPKRPSMYYVSMDGTDWYVGSDGNHRTCIARFLFAETGRTMLHGVHLADYRFDHELHRLYLRLTELARRADPAILVEPVNRAVGRDDTPGWKLDYFEPRIRFVDPAEGLDERLDADGARRIIGWLREERGRRGWFRLRRRAS